MSRRASSRAGPRLTTLLAAWSEEEQQGEEDEDDEPHAAVEALLDDAELVALGARLGGQHQAQPALGVVLRIGLGIGLALVAHAVVTPGDARAAPGTSRTRPPAARARRARAPCGRRRADSRAR